MCVFSSVLKRTLLLTTALSLPQVAIAQEEEQEEVELIEELVVTGSYIPDEKRATSEIASLLDGLDFTQTGDGDIATALQRLPGLSLVGGKFVFVRGLGDRYSSVLLDRVSVPSPEPLRRVVPLDIFPTNLLGGALVQKTYSPQYPLEFGGGVIDLRSKAVPDEGFFEIGVSGAYNTETTGKRGLSYDGSGTDFLGFDNGKRDLPDLLAASPDLTGLNDQGLEQAAEALANVWTIDQERNPAEFGLVVDFGDRFETDSGSFGYVATFRYDSSFRNQFGVRNSYATSDDGLILNDQINPDACLDFEGATNCGLRSTEWTIDVNGILSLGWEINNDHTLKARSMLLRQTTREAQIQQGLFQSDPSFLQQQNRIEWIERNVWSHLLSGEHYVSLFSEPTEILWRAGYSTSDRNAPLRRTYQYNYIEADQLFRLSPRPDGNITSFGELSDEIIDLGLDFSQPFSIGSTGINGDFNFGAAYQDKSRTSEFLRYSLSIPNGAPSELLERVPEIIFGTFNIRPDGVELREFTDPSDFFQSGVEIFQAYGAFDIQLTEKLRAAFGMRYEDSVQTSDTFTRGSITVLPDGTTLRGPDGLPVPAGSPLLIEQDAEYFLPSATLTYEFIENMQIRFGFSQTVTRPDLRELSFANFLDPDRDTPIRGNPFLQITEIDNYDLRWEWYFGTGDVATIGVFYKDFTNPIEQTFQQLGEGPVRSYANALSAELLGVEGELEKYLPLADWFFQDSEWMAAKEFYVKLNASYIDSSVDLDPVQAGQATSQTRPLQGQSDVLANFQIGWDDPVINETFAVVLNYTGKRINDVGIQGVPDVIETPPLMLNLSYGRDVDLFGTTFGISLRAENLLNEDFVLKQGGFDFERWNRGITFSLGITARL